MGDSAATTDTWEEGAPSLPRQPLQAPSSLLASNCLLVRPVPVELVRRLTHGDLAIAAKATINQRRRELGLSVNQLRLRLQDAGYFSFTQRSFWNYTFLFTPRWDSLLLTLSAVLDRHPAWFLGVPTPSFPYPWRGSWALPLVSEVGLWTPHRLWTRLNSLGLLEPYGYFAVYDWMNRAKLPSSPLALFHLSAVLNVPVWKLVPTQFPNKPAGRKRKKLVRRRRKEAKQRARE